MDEHHLNEDDHCVNPDPTGHKAKIRTLRTTDAIFAKFLYIFLEWVSSPCHIPVLGDLLTAKVQIAHLG